MPDYHHSLSSFPPAPTTTPLSCCSSFARPTGCSAWAPRFILFDIDDFAHWNARLGAQSGDELLIQTVTRIQRLLRSYDLIGRTGSDDFLAVLPRPSPINAVLLAERIATHSSSHSTSRE